MKILIISYFFAPSTVANAKRPFFFARGFLDAGWDVDVVSSCSFVPNGCSELIKHPKLTIRRPQDPLDSIEKKLPNNWVGKVVFAVLRSVLWPDIMVAWAWKISRTVDTSKYDRVLVSIVPASMILLGWIARADQRWVFDYQETASPSYPGTRRSPVYRWLMPLYTRLQRAVLEKTNHVVFATKSYIQDYVRHGLVEKGKAVHIPLFFDDAAFSHTRLPSKTFILSYCGQFQKHREGRNPKVFLEALRLFLSRVPDARSSVEFRFYGRWDEGHNRHISESKLQDVVRINPAVPYDRYIKLLSEATVLLLVTCKGDNLFVPSKMMDYFGARRPILGFVPPESETYEILDDAGMAQYTSGETDVESGAQNIEQLWNVWRDGRLDCSFELTEQWSASVQVPRMVQLLNK